jgi:hypothetical protein
MLRGRSLEGGLVVAVALAAVTAMSGCGSDPGSDRDQIRAVLADVQEGYDDGDLARVCDGLTAAARRHVISVAHEATGTCARNLRIVQRAIAAKRGQPPAVTRKVVGIRISGDTATATLDFGGGSSGEVPLSREDGKWKVNGLYGGLPAQRQTDKF